MILFSVILAAAGFRRTLIYFLDPNKPLLPKIGIISASLIAVLIYNVWKRKNRNKDTAKKTTEGKPTVGIQVCPYCGAEYTSDKAVCAIDQSRLVPK